MTTYRDNGAVGAASELTASAWLLARGFLVFRNVAASGPFDLVAYRDGALSRVEVKSVSANGSPGWPTNDEWDLLLMVDPITSTVWDQPNDGADPGMVRAVVRSAYFQIHPQALPTPDSDLVTEVKRIRAAKRDARRMAQNGS